MKIHGIITVLFIIFILGCAGSSNPTIPSATDMSNPARSESTSNHTLWGWADIICNTETGEVEFIPSRITPLHINVLMPVMSSLGMHIQIDSDASDFPNGLFVLDVAFTHPFAGADKFSGFDVKGILMSPGSFNLGPVTLADFDETQLLNKDGLTRWWNPTEFTGDGFLLGYTPGKPGSQDAAELTAALNPYKVFADALDFDSPTGDLIIPQLTDPDGRSIFTAGTTNTRRYEIQFPVSGGPVLKFNYAIDASWNPPSPNPPGEVPDDFPMSANQPEPFRIQIVFPVNSLEYLVGGSVTGDLRVRAIISDWQGMDAGDIQSEIAEVTVWAPTLLNDVVTLDYVTESFDHATYEAEVSNYILQLDTADPHMLLVSAETAASDGTYTQGGTTTGPNESIMAWNSETVTIAQVICEADGNDEPSAAEPIDLGGDAFGTLCNPGGSGTDAEDWYTFDVPSGNTAFGSISLECLEVPTTVGLYDDMQVLLDEATISAGTAKIGDPGELAEGIYYIRIATTNPDEVVYYDVFNDYILNPCDDVIDFSWETQVDETDLNNVGTATHSVIVDGLDVWVVYAEGPGSTQAIMCRHSGDGSLSWDPAVQVNLIEIATSRLWPSIAKDNNGRIYCAWTDWGSGASEPMVNSSIDGGLTWSLEVSIYDFETGTLQSNNETRSIIIDTDDTGILHAVWLDRRVPSEHHLFYSSSSDQGTTWDPADQVDESPVQLQASFDMYDFDVAPDGTVACVWTDRRGIYSPPLTSLDVYCDTRTSATPFGTDVMVNPDDLDFEQTMPGVAITDDGTIHVAWVDRRNDGAFGGTNPTNSWEPYYARSEDGGATFIAETEIPTVDGYSQNGYMGPRIVANPWGSVYVLYQWGQDFLYLSRSCNGGDTWEPEITAFEKMTDTHFLQTHSFDVTTSGQIYVLHVDTRVEPGGDYTHWNCFLNVSD